MKRTVLALVVLFISATILAIVAILNLESSQKEAARLKNVVDSLRTQVEYTEKKWRALEDISELPVWNSCHRPPLVVVLPFYENPLEIDLTRCDGKEIQYQIFHDGTWRETGLTWQHQIGKPKK